MKIRAFSLLLCIISIFCSCSDDGVEYDEKISNAVAKTNAEEKIKVAFVAEITDSDANDLIMFVQGNYQLDKQSKTIANGELVQTVFETPSSIEFGFYDDTYVTISDNIRILSDMDEDTLFDQFMFAPAIDFPVGDVSSISTSESSGGTIYTISINEASSKKYLEKLFGDDIYTFSSMKKPKKELTEYSDFVCKYVISDDGYIKSRETSYKMTAFDTAPYFPGSQATADQYKRTFNISIKINYKQFGDDVEVDVSKFIYDEDSDESSSDSTSSENNDSHESISGEAQSTDDFSSDNLQSKAQSTDGLSDINTSN